MVIAFSQSVTLAEQDRAISTAVTRERERLRAFIRKRVFDRDDAEDILQDVLQEFVTAYRLMQPLEEASAWLFRVARNRIIDFFRKARPSRLADQTDAELGETEPAQELLPSRDGGPDAALASEALFEQLAEALEELPREQREVFIAHELEGARFNELAQRWNVGVNTLLSRKRYAVLQLRKRMQDVYDEWFDE